MKVLILAGGFATRLWPLTEHRAKPLLLLGGQTILGRILGQVLGGVEQEVREEDVIILTNKKFEQEFGAELQKLGYDGVKIYIEDAESDGEKKGALGAVWDCIEHYGIDENISILAGDNVIPEFSIRQLSCSEDEAKILVKDIGDLYQAKKFGVVEVNEEMRVVGFEEKPSEPKSTLVSTGFVGLGKGCFPVLEDFVKHSPDNLGGLFAAILSSTQVHQYTSLQVLAEEVQGDWFDVGSFETYLEAHRKLNEKLPSDQATKLSNINSETSSNMFSGAVFVGDGCEVQDCTLIDCIIYPGTRLHDCRLANCAIDSDCDLEGVDLCGKLVRKGTRLKNN